MLTELCQELRNWFDRERHFGTFEITDGNITAPFLTEGQYYRIVGSLFNDGVHKYPDCDLNDETFDGAVWALAIPQPVIKLSQEIQAWRDKYEAADGVAMSPFASESFGGYSYTKASGSSTSVAGGVTWQSMFRKRLNAWRKI